MGTYNTLRLFWTAEFPFSEDRCVWDTCSSSGVCGPLRILCRRKWLDLFGCYEVKTILFSFFFFLGVNIWLAFIILHSGGSLRLQFDHTKVLSSSHHWAVSMVGLVLGWPDRLLKIRIIFFSLSVKCRRSVAAQWFRIWHCLSLLWCGFHPTREFSPALGVVPPPPNI